MIVARTIDEARAALRELPRPLGFVPTMGALHAGHLTLVEAAKARCASVAASDFVNPTQFGPGEDFDAYPRDEAGDFARFEEAGVGLVFAPPAGEMYPGGNATTVHVGGPLTESFEGASRPGHFDGMALVVVKLLEIVRPDAGFFGQKDAQQLAIVRRFVRDLDLPVEIVGVPTVREPDGLALSSRNAYLTPAQRTVAPDLYRALMTGAAAAGKPGATPKDAIVAATMVLATPDACVRDDADRLRELRDQAPPAAPRFDIDYLAIVDADTFVAETVLGPRSLLIAAARLGTTRLIDNVFASSSAYPTKDATT